MAIRVQSKLNIKCDWCCKKDNSLGIKDLIFFDGGKYGVDIMIDAGGINLHV